VKDAEEHKVMEVFSPKWKVGPISSPWQHPDGGKNSDNCGVSGDT
jgi:hypothetical protein